ncbi:MAG TPA: hypothetical protein ENN81_03675 [Phycisphaerales bacterium]|nr:hypothetical protein [Phycisphaerales bacterium]
MDNNDYNTIKPLRNIGPLTGIDRRDRRRRNPAASDRRSNARRQKDDEPDDTAGPPNSTGTDASQIDYCA